MLLCPSDDDLRHAVEHNIIGNNALCQIDVRNTKKIYGSSEPSLKRKSLNRKSKLPREDVSLKRPKEINSKFASIMLLFDVIHGNQIPFLVSKSYHTNHYQTCAPDNLKANYIT